MYEKCVYQKEICIDWMNNSDVNIKTITFLSCTYLLHGKLWLAGIYFSRYWGINNSKSDVMKEEAKYFVFEM